MPPIASVAAFRGNGFGRLGHGGVRIPKNMATHCFFHAASMPAALANQAVQACRQLS